MLFENGDIPASYVSLPEGNPKSLPRSQVRINDLAAPPEPINPLMCRCHLKRRGFGLCKILVQPGGWTKILKHRINSGQGFRIYQIKLLEAIFSS